MLFSLKIRSHLQVSPAWCAITWAWMGCGRSCASRTPKPLQMLLVSMLQWGSVAYCWTVWCSECQAALFWLSTLIWDASTRQHTVVFLVGEHFWWFRFLFLVKTPCSRTLSTAQLCSDLITALPRHPTTAQRQLSCLKPALWCFSSILFFLGLPSLPLITLMCLSHLQFGCWRFKWDLGVWLGLVLWAGGLVAAAPYLTTQHFWAEILTKLAVNLDPSITCVLFAPSFLRVGFQHSIAFPEIPRNVCPSWGFILLAHMWLPQPVCDAPYEGPAFPQ